jgi:uncharacterized protein (DUF342 family)
MGKKSGYNLFGEEILPIPGRDFILQAGNGTRLSPDRMKIFADAEGAIVVRKEETKVSTMGYTEAFPREVHLRIDPLVVVEALRTVEIVTKNSVEVKGDLHPNSNIVSDGEVYVAGDVGANTKIHAQDDIIIQGNVEQGTVISSKNIFTGGAVSLSTLSAKGSVKVEGLIKNSQVWGQEVEVERLNNSTVVAEKRAIIRSVESDEANILSEIRVGVKAYNQMRINENNEFILFLRGDLRKLRDLFGKEVVEDTTYSNTELMFLKFVKLYGRTKALKETKLESLREVFDSIPSVKIMINEKNKENEKLKVEMSKEKKVPGSVIIYEKIESPVLIQINSSKTEFAPGEGGKFALKEGQVVKEELDQEWQKLEEGKR